jgi:hypothetical protein
MNATHDTIADTSSQRQIKIRGEAGIAEAEAQYLVYMRVAALSCVTKRVQMILSRFKT